MLKLDLSSLKPPRPNQMEPVRAGDIMRTRQGRLYLMAALPLNGSGDEYAYYFTLDRDGNVTRVGQALLGFIEHNWERIGHTEIKIGPDVEWFI